MTKNALKREMYNNSNNLHKNIIVNYYWCWVLGIGIGIGIGMGYYIPKLEKSFRTGIGKNSLFIAL